MQVQLEVAVLVLVFVLVLIVLVLVAVVRLESLLRVTSKNCFLKPLHQDPNCAEHVQEVPMVRTHRCPRHPLHYRYH